MKKNVILMVVLLFVAAINAQKSQRIAYIDMDYILKNIPEYLDAQNALEAKVKKWKTKLDKESKAIEALKIDLSNEKAILTEDLIKEREEDIKIKEESLRNLESLYFGPDGDMYILRRKLIQPVQDQVYNTVQNIAKKKKYDFVFDKSSDLVMLYSNKKHDISDLIVRLIKINQKRKAKSDKIAERKKLLNQEELSDEQKKKLAEKEALKKKREAEKKARYDKIEANRQARLKAIEEKRKLLRAKKEALRKSREEAKKKAIEEKKKQKINK